MSKQWRAVYTSPRSEKKIAARLSDAGYEVYCPMYKSIRQWSDRKKTIWVPLFTSYVFVRTGAALVEDILRIQGIKGFVYWLGKPAVIREDEIEKIKEFLDEFPNARAQAISLKVGEKVSIEEGPLKGNVGTVKEVRKHRAVLIIEGLGFELIAELHKNKVA